MFDFAELKISRETKKLEKERLSLEDVFRKEVNSAAQIYSSPVFNLLSDYFVSKLDINYELMKYFNPLNPKHAAKLAMLMSENKVIESFFNDMEYAKQSIKEIVS